MTRRAPGRIHLTKHITITIILGILGTIVFCIIAYGCTPQQSVRVLTVPSVQGDLATFPADLRGAYIFPDGAKIRYCAEPVPDIAIQSMAKISGQLQALIASGQTISASASYDLTTQAIELAGRTQLLLIAREMLYRACELSINNPNDIEIQVQLYSRVADLVEKLGESDLNKSKANLLKLSAPLQPH